MRESYKIKNTGAQISKTPKSVSVPSGVRGVRGKDLR